MAENPSANSAAKRKIPKAVTPKIPLGGWSVPLQQKLEQKSDTAVQQQPQPTTTVANAAPQEAKKKYTGGVSFTDKRVLVIDTGSIIRGMRFEKYGSAFYTTENVLREVRDSNSRHLLTTLPFELKTRTYTPEAMQAVSRFAKKTGDFHQLSKNDLEVLALAYTLEVECNGDEHIRKEPKTALTRGKGYYKADVMAYSDYYKDLAQKRLQATNETEGSDAASQPTDNTEEDTNENEDNEEVNDAWEEIEGHRYAGSDNEGDNSDEEDDEHENEANDDDNDGFSVVSYGSRASSRRSNADEGWSVVPDRNAKYLARSTAGDKKSTEDTWITPKNIRQLQNESRAGGALVPWDEPETSKAAPPADTDKPASSSTTEQPIDAENATAVDSTQEQQQSTEAQPEAEADQVQSAVGCVTTDFAMQNVLLQMGLNVVSVDGMRIRHVTTWVLRCHACGTVVHEMNRLFCPGCGNQALLRVSCVVDDNGDTKYLINPKRKFNLRGAKFHLPLPKGGRNAEQLILREDQLPGFAWRRNPDSSKQHKTKNKSASMWDPDHPILGEHRARKPHRGIVLRRNGTKSDKRK